MDFDKRTLMFTFAAMKSKVLKYAVLLLAFILFTWVLWGFPEVFDTVKFRYIYYANGGTDSAISLSAFSQLLSYLYYHDNLRLAQIISVPLALYVPHVVVSGLLSLLLVLAFYYGTAMCFPGHDLHPGAPSWKKLVWFWLVATLFLPWRANVFTIIYSENYFPALAGVMWCTWRLAMGGFTHARLWLFGLMVLIISWTHEQAAATLWCGAGLYILIHRFRAPVQYWIITIIALLVFVGMSLIPGTTARFNDMYPAVFHLFYIKYVVGMHAWVILMLGVMGVMACRHRWRAYLVRVLSAPQYLVLLVGALACTTMNCATYCPMRAALIPDLCAIVVTSALLSPLWCILKDNISYAFTACTGVVLIALVCLWSHIALWQMRIGTEYEWAQNLVLTPGQSPVYYDFKYIDAAPATALGIPQRNIIDIQFGFYNNFTGNDRYIVPTDLRGRFMDRSVPVAGNFKAYRVNKTLYRIMDSWDHEYKARITLKDGEVRNFTLLAIPFTAEDGVRYHAFHLPKVDTRNIVRIDY